MRWWVIPPLLCGCTGDPCKNGPYLQRVTSESVTISWETTGATESTVEWGPTPAYGRLATSSVPAELHEIELTGLSPSTTYYYRVVAGAATSAGAELVTAPEGSAPFRFAVYGDTQSNFYVHSLIADAILEEAPALVLHAGDEVGEGSDYASWGTEYFGPGAALMAAAPVYAAMGNHEENARWFYHYHSTLRGQSWYAFRYGGAFFVVLDTNKDYAPGSPQHAWLVETLSSEEARSADWRFTVYHHPAVTAGWHDCGSGYDGEVNVRAFIVPLEREHHVDVTFNGHAHGYQRGYRDGVHQIVTGGGGGDLDHPCGEQSAIAYAEYVHHYVIVDLTERSLHLIAHRRDGSVLDELMVEK
jgi:hypothetical protein